MPISSRHGSDLWQTKNRKMNALASGGAWSSISGEQQLIGEIILVISRSSANLATEAGTTDPTS
jgi:hypothetical protein